MFLKVGRDWQGSVDVDWLQGVLQRTSGSRVFTVPFSQFSLTV